MLGLCGSDKRLQVKIGLFCTTPSVELGRVMPMKQAMEMLLTGDAMTAAQVKIRSALACVCEMQEHMSTRTHSSSHNLSRGRVLLCACFRSARVLERSV